MKLLILFCKNILNYYMEKDVCMVTLTTSVMFLLFTCMHLWLEKILQTWSACAPTAYEVVLDCQKFEKNWYRYISLKKNVNALLSIQYSFKLVSLFHEERSADGVRVSVCLSIFL
jgi:hypothetical protein